MNEECQYSNNELEQILPRLYKYALRLVKNHHDAQDVAQASIIRVIKSVRKNEDKGIKNSYLWQVVRSVVVDEWRKYGGKTFENIEDYEEKVADSNEKSLNEMLSVRSIESKKKDVEGINRTLHNFEEKGKRNFFDEYGV